MDANLAEEEKRYRETIVRDPRNAAAFFGLATLAERTKQIDVAIQLYEKTLALDPNHAEAMNNLAILLVDHKREVERGAKLLQRAVQLHPTSGKYVANLAQASRHVRELDTAYASAKRATKLDPNRPSVFPVLGDICRGVGLIDESIAAFRRAVELEPANARPHSDLCFVLHLDPKNDAAAIAREHRAFDERHAKPLFDPRPHANDTSPDRRLRIGYVSPDFDELHPIGRFFSPLLAVHDREHFEIACYSGVRKPDDLTKKLQSLSNLWRDVSLLDDAPLAEQIRDDGIDILVDLSLHAPGNRLLTFARKPAPIQLTYLGYCSTTGLSAMDYRISDAYLDPPGGDESVYAEKTVRLPGSYWAYEPLASAPAVAPPPAHRNGFVTFGCFNSVPKISDFVIELWAEVLRGMTSSRMTILYVADLQAQRMRDIFKRHDVDPHRIDFVPRRSLQDYFRAHESIDIALDAFPAAGGTTTCDALWMGVPVVTLTGPTAVSRAGSCILSHVGHAELIANTPAQYVSIATTLAGDLNRLRTIRLNLRDRMRQSPITDVERLARGLEGIYRNIWRQKR